MTVRIEYPTALIDEVKKLGVQLGTGIDLEDPGDAVYGLSQELKMAEQANFGGFSLKKLGRGIGKIGKAVVNNKVIQVVNPAVALTVGKGPMAQLGKKFAPGYADAVKKVEGAARVAKAQVNKLTVPKSIAIKSGPAVASFAVPANMNLKAALAGADKLLGDPKLGNSTALVRNTKALAALGDPAAKRGVAVLTAAAAVRAAKKAPVGKAAVPKPPTPVNAKALTQVKTKAQVNALAIKTNAAKAADAKTSSWFVRMMKWLGIQKK